MVLPLILALLSQQTAAPAKTLTLQAVTHHVQGIDTDGVTLWVTSVDQSTHKGYLMSFSLKDGKLERSIEVQDGDRYHPGGIDTDADSIWMPVAEYKRSSTATIQQRDKRTLELKFQFTVDDHIGCIAVTPDFIIGGNWDSKDFYFWDHKGKLVRKVTSTTGNSYQDLKWVSGNVVGSGTTADRQGAVDWLELPGLGLAKRQRVGATDKGQSYAREGMTIFGNELYMLPEDDTSRLFIFPL